MTVPRRGVLHIASKAHRVEARFGRLGMIVIDRAELVGERPAASSVKPG